MITEDLTKLYPGKKRAALDQFCLSVKAHTIHAFLGPNGAGKTTTMNILSGLLRQTAGRAFLLGKETTQNWLFVRENLGFLAERPALYSEMRVGDFLYFRARLHGLSRREARLRVGSVAEKLKLQELQGSWIEHLSKGFVQRVGVASALIANPKVLILDEPAAGLDPASIRQMRNLLLDLKQNHTILFSSHQLGEVAQVCDDITIIKDGKLVISDSFKRVQQEFSKRSPLQLVLRGDPAGIQSILSEFGEVKIASHPGGEQWVQLYGTSIDEFRGAICRNLVMGQVEVLEIKRAAADLESIFMDLVGSRK